MTAASREVVELILKKIFNFFSSIEATRFTCVVCQVQFQYETRYLVQYGGTSIYQVPHVVTGTSRPVLQVLVWRSTNYIF